MTGDDRDLERGPQGDHGQRGERGDRGEQGPTGITRLQALAFFVVAVGAVLGYGFYQDQSLAQSRYDGCLGGRMLLETFNAQQQGLADVDRDVKSTLTNQETAEQVQRRIDLYEAGILPLPDCELLKP